MVLGDTGYWVALINPADRHHHRATAITRNLSEQLITTWPVVTETCYLLAKHVGVSESLKFLEMISSKLVAVSKITVSDLDRLTELMNKYRDLPMDLADASLVILAEELGHGRILSTDQRDFNTYRWKNHKPFENLLVPDG